jgi:pathogenesis-related protein 1
MMSRRFGLILLTALLPVMLQALPASAEGVTAAKRQAIVDLHNKYRAQHCAPALTWSNEIAAAAQRWADKCRFSHNTADKFGENIAWGGDRTIESSIEAWYSEVKNYNFARPGTSSGVGHFTQIVWKDTKQIGCGVSKCFLGTVRYWVCQYSPQANWEGKFGANVLPRCEAQPKASAAKPTPAAPAIR